MQRNKILPLKPKYTRKGSKHEPTSIAGMFHFLVRIHSTSRFGRSGCSNRSLNVDIDICEKGQVHTIGNGSGSESMARAPPYSRFYVFESLSKGVTSHQGQYRSCECVECYNLQGTKATRR